MSARTITQGAFELTVYDGREETPARVRAAYSELENEKTRERVYKAAQYLGPWCPNCGKKGTACSGRSAKSCRTRAFKRATRGLDAKRLHGVSLPRAYAGDDLDARTRRAYAVAMNHAGFEHDEEVAKSA